MNIRRILSLTGTVFPKAEIQSVDAAAGIATFRWLDANDVPVDSGGSVARFTPVAPLPQETPNAPVQYPDVTDAVLADAIANPPPSPAPVVVLSPLTILSRMTPQEEAALTASNDLAVAIVRNRLIAASEVRSDDPRTDEGKAILVAKGIITAERAAEIFA